MIIGSFPIGKFTNPDRKNEIKEHEYDFFFGGEKNLLWKILAEVFGVTFSKKEDIKKFLTTQKIAVGDVVKSCVRKRGRGSDSDLVEIEWNEKLLEVLQKHNIKKVYFTSKKVEVWFNRLFPDSGSVEKITLISPSAQSLRSLSRMPGFKEWVKRYPDEKKIRFIVDDYLKKFKA